MKTEFWIESLEFKNNLIVNLKKNSIVVFVGPNNSGKSQILREISQQTKGSKINNIILESLTISASGDGDDFLKRIENRRKDKTYFYYESNYNSGIDAHSLKGYWNELVKGDKTSYSSISNFLVKSMDTVKRLNLVSPPDNIDFINEMRTHSIHVLKEDREKNFSFQNISKKLLEKK